MLCCWRWCHQRWWCRRSHVVVRWHNIIHKLSFLPRDIYATSIDWRSTHCGSDHAAQPEATWWSFTLVGYAAKLRPPRRRFCDRCGLAVSRSVILSACLCVTYERVYGRRPNMARTGKGRPSRRNYILVLIRIQMWIQDHFPLPFTLSDTARYDIRWLARGRHRVTP